MPTILLLDTSISMLRPFPSGDNGDTITLMQLAHSAINYYLDYLSAHEKLEFVALVTFSSVCETCVNFTRDFDLIRSKLFKLEEGDEAHVDQGLAGVTKLVLSEWGPSIPCNVVLLTDGSPANVNIASPMFPLPFPFPAKLHILSMSAPPSSAHAVFHRLVEMAGGVSGCVLHPEPGPLSTAGVALLVKKLVETTYSSYVGAVRCGNLTARIGLYPAPAPHMKHVAGETVTSTFADTLDIFGFIDLHNLASPMSVSRHLVTPLPSGKQDKVKAEGGEGEGEEGEDEGKMPSLCVLLHGALKVENVAALCTVGDDWFGVLYSWADSKKKSNLMLTVFEPGPDAVPWLGNLNYLAALDEFPMWAQTSPEPPTFPVRPTERRSYSQNSNVTWIRKSGLQTDIQKVLRNAKRLPEKTQQFYKELNKLRKAAVCFGFIELLDGLAAILERECQTLPPGTHPDCALQLDHACDILRRPISRDPKTTILPIKTRYQPDHD